MAMRNKVTVLDILVFMVLRLKAPLKVLGDVLLDRKKVYRSQNHVIEYKIYDYMEIKWSWSIREKYWYEYRHGGWCPHCGVWTDIPKGVRPLQVVRCGSDAKGGRNTNGCGLKVFT